MPCVAPKLVLTQLRLTFWVESDLWVEGKADDDTKYPIGEAISFILEYLHKNTALTTSIARAIFNNRFN